MPRGWRVIGPERRQARAAIAGDVDRPPIGGKRLAARRRRSQPWRGRRRAAGSARPPPRRTAMCFRPISQERTIQAKAAAPVAPSNCAAGPARVCQKQQGRRHRREQGDRRPAGRSSRSRSLRVTWSIARPPIRPAMGKVRIGHRRVPAMPPDRHRLAHLGKPQPLELGRALLEPPEAVRPGPGEGAGDDRAAQSGGAEPPLPALSARPRRAAPRPRPPRPWRRARPATARRTSAGGSPPKRRARKPKAQPPASVTP